MLPFTALLDKGSFLPACLFKGDFVLLRGVGWMDSQKHVLFIHSTGTTWVPKTFFVKIWPILGPAHHCLCFQLHGQLQGAMCYL